ncbi:MAG: RNA polymerase sigma factor [Thermoanaerobaculia bacterium]
MARSSEQGNPLEDLFLDHLPLVERVIAFTCRRYRLRGEEAEELGAQVKARLVEDDYAVFRKFQGQSNLATYLTTVVQRLFLDRLRARKGRPRPSAEARRLGAVAIRLERLLYWDGFSFDEACRILQENHGVDVSWQELEEVAGRLPARVIERRHEGGEEPARLAGALERPDEAALARERDREAERVVEALEGALAVLDAEDRLILRMRFEDDFTVADVARALSLPQKPLYRRIDALKRHLRRELEARGLRSLEGWWS